MSWFPELSDEVIRSNASRGAGSAAEARDIDMSHRLIEDEQSNTAAEPKPQTLDIEVRVSVV
jgi:hypothetical protein